MRKREREREQQKKEGRGVYRECVFVCVGVYDKDSETHSTNDLRSRICKETRRELKRQKYDCCNKEKGIREGEYINQEYINLSKRKRERERGRKREREREQKKRRGVYRECVFVCVGVYDKDNETHSTNDLRSRICKETRREIKRQKYDCCNKEKGIREGEYINQEYINLSKREREREREIGRKRERETKKKEGRGYIESVCLYVWVCMIKTMKRTQRMI